jgi:hypothetical protein
MTGTPCQSDSQSLTDPPREPVEIPKDGRRPATSGSSERATGGSAASGKSKPPSLTREQRQQVDAFFQALPKQLADLVPDRTPGNLKTAVLEALAVGQPEERTAEQVVEFRMLPKWSKHYASKDAAGPIRKPVGVLMALLKRDAECGDKRCDERTNVDTGEPCISCEQRAVNKRAERAQEAGQEAAPEPAAAPKSQPSSKPARVPAQPAGGPGGEWAPPSDEYRAARALTSGQRRHR